MKINDYKRGLTSEEYAKVLNDCIGKVEGLNDLDWDEIVTKYNLGIHRDVLRKAFQSPMGGYSVYKYLQEEQINNKKSNSMLDEVRKAIGELDIKKQEVRTKTNQLNKIKRNFIKSIEIANDIKECLIENTEIPKLNYRKDLEISDNKLIVQISDWHVGYCINNYKGNSYNYEIAKKRLSKLLEEIKKTCKLYNINYVVIANCGDIIEHVSMRNTNQAFECEFNLGQQISHAIKLLFSFIKEIADMGNKVEYYSCTSNHARLNGMKEMNIEGDDADVIIRDSLESLFELYGNKNIHINKTDYKDGTSEFELNGMMFKVMHGDNRPMNDKKLFDGETSSHNTKYKAILRGHFHNFNVTSQNSNGYVITSSCLFGYNSYSMKKMLCNTNASQTLIVVNENDIETIKNVNLQIN